MVFLVALFLVKKTSLLKNTVEFVKNKQEGLAYNGTIGDLVSKDTDGDEILDWEEPLYGLDPTKKETTPGIPDSTVVNKLKTEQGLSAETTNRNQEIENLTQTDKFSRELFSTVASLNQSGTMDQAIADQIGNSLADRIKNSVSRKIYVLTEIKIIDDNSVAAAQKYKNALISLYEKYPGQTQVEEVLAKFVGDGASADENALAELAPIVKQAQEIIDGWVKITVRNQLAQAHLNAINAMERVLENVSDLQLYDNDPIVAISAVENYQKNIPLLQSALDARANAINQKLKS